MPREIYHPADNQWVMHSKFDSLEFAQDVFDDVGQQFPIRIDTSGSVIVDFDNLPAGVSENDVKQAVRDNHPNRK